MLGRKRPRGWPLGKILYCVNHLPKQTCGEKNTCISASDAVLVGSITGKGKRASLPEFTTITCCSSLTHYTLLPPYSSLSHHTPDPLCHLLTVSYSVFTLLFLSPHAAKHHLFIALHASHSFITVMFLSVIRHPILRVSHSVGSQHSI